MNLDALLAALGYLNSKQHWITPERADVRLAHYYQLAKRAGEEAGEGANVVGCYTYETSLNDKLTPPRPAVFVAQVTDEAQAREIHKRLWNLGDCPFIVMVLPNVVRVYTGFDYDSDVLRRGIITEVVPFADAVPDPLKPFDASTIDSGNLWQEQAKHLTSDTRVDYRLLKNLKELSQDLQKEHNLSREVAHSLIGKYIYFRYLRDRGILGDTWLRSQNILPEQVFSSEGTAAGFASLAVALQHRFNGDIFPLPTSDDELWKFNGAIPYLIGIFNGNTTYGQLALDFQVYDFSFIPIELLSSIYEEFLKAEGKGEGDGVVYTPEPLADYVLAELEAVHPLRLGHKVLDPCCGSGVFLVLAYRRLIQKLWREQNARPSAEAMKSLLTESIFGVEKDREACHIAAFSLILTLLSQLEPPELQVNSEFHFPTLVGENLHEADFFSLDCPVFHRAERFDWVVGNPPWSGADVRNDAHKPALAWMREATKEGRAVGERRLDEAFTWRVSDLLQDGGFAALLIKATTLVNPSSSEYRKDFFKAHTVHRITNLANLRYLLFMGPDGKRAVAPAACLVYRNANPDERKPSILHFGPFVANQLPIRTKGGRRRVWTIALYESDIQEIDPNEAEEDVAFLWKSALWGSPQDRRALRRLQHIMPKTIGEYANHSEWSLNKGLEFYRGRSESASGFVLAPELAGKDQFIAERAGRLMAGDDAIVPLLPAQQFIRNRSGKKGLTLIAAPHLVITSEGSLYSDIDFVIPSPKVGIAAPRNDASRLKAVAFYLNSSIARYLHFFSNPPWGIYIYASTKDSVGSIPIADLTEKQIDSFATAYDALAERERDHTMRDSPLNPEPLDLQSEIDTIVESVLNIPESIRIVAREFMQVRFQLNEGKVGDTANDSPSQDTLRQYAEKLRSHLDDFTRRRHQISIQAGPEAIIATAEVTDEKERLSVNVSTGWNNTARDILESVHEQHSQWAYVCRSVRIFSGPRVHIVKSARWLDWTQTQAIQDASDLISEVLDKTTPHYEPIAA